MFCQHFGHSSGDGIDLFQRVIEFEVRLLLQIRLQLISPSAGDIFSIVTYSTTFLEASIALPVALQAMTRLAEISSRINSDVSEDG